MEQVRCWISLLSGLYLLSYSLLCTREIITYFLPFPEEYINGNLIFFKKKSSEKAKTLNHEVLIYSFLILQFLLKPVRL